MKACSEHSQTKSDAHNGRFQGLKFEALVEERVDRDDDVLSDSKQVRLLLHVLVNERTDLVVALVHRPR